MWICVERHLRLQDEYEEVSDLYDNFQYIFDGNRHYQATNLILLAAYITEGTLYLCVIPSTAQSDLR